MPSEDRAIAMGILMFIATIIVIALFYTLMDPAVTQIESTTTAATSSTEATSVINERVNIWGYLLFFGVFYATITLIARSVFESRGGV